MPSISNKGRAMPQSPIRKLVPYAKQAEKQGKTIYYLNIGQPDIAPPQGVIEALQQPIAHIPYSQSEGSESYRQKLANYYSTHNIAVSHNDIIVTTGASEALLFVFGSILDPGDEVIIPEPFYANYTAFSTASEAKIVPIVSRLEDNFALPPIADFETCINAKTKAILICNPNNPTGYLYTEEELNALAALVKKHDLFLISDEVYREFTYEGHTHHSVMEQMGLESRAIMIDSVSKRYSMCGARVGCVVSKNKELLATILKFAQARLSPPTLAQIASEAALDTPPEYFETVIATYAARRNVLMAELQKIEGVKIAQPQGAFYLIAELPVKDSDAFARWLLEDFDSHGETLMVAPAAGFYSTPNEGKNQIRIAYVLNEDALVKAVNILKKALQTYLQITKNDSD